MHISSSYAKILGQKLFRTREFPRSWSKAKDGKERKRSKVGDNNGQATHGARKHAWRTQAAWANSKSRIDQFEGSFVYNNMSQSTNHTNLLDVEGSTLRRCRSEKRNTNYNFENNKIQESFLCSLSQTPSYPKPTVNVERLSPKKVCNEENMFSKFHRLSLRNPKASNSEPTTPTKRLILEPVPLK